MFISLIIPVYNVEKYLDKCIKSVIMHKPEEYDMEMILVDDGSTDSSGEICDQYARSYSYIKVIHKPNGGLSSARNEGIHQANGQYVMFMDSDDWWNPDVDFKYIAECVKENETTEMFLFFSYDYVENEGYYKRNEHNNIQQIRTEDGTHYYQSLLDIGNLEVSACTKVLKKSFIVKDKLFFKEGLLSEDNEWMLRLLRRLSKVRVIDQPLYICRMNRQGSITNTIKRKNIEDLLKIIRSSQKYCDSHPDYKNLKLELCYASYLWFSALGLSTLLDRKEQKAVRKWFVLTSNVCKYSNSRKTKICYVIYKIMGITLTSKVLGIYIKLKGRRTLNRTKVGDISQACV